MYPAYDSTTNLHTLLTGSTPVIRLLSMKKKMKGTSDLRTALRVYYAAGSGTTLVRNYRYSLHMFLSFILLYVTGKLVWKMFKKVHRSEFNKLL
jgi:hypothetical protein